MILQIENLVLLQFVLISVCSDQNVCDGDFKECVPTNQCEEYQEDYSILKQITNRNSFQYKELRQKLRDSVSKIQHFNKLVKTNVSRFAMLLKSMCAVLVLVSKNKIVHTLNI